ncbi:hypothetical protein AB0O67_05050 [Streptomyces sp. NPDC086077]|uniref:ABC transporter permease n=1 Tax=Streptomyces sp. NPDC086077 TaxID=3154862 RepID=UPI003440B8CC
MSDSHAPALPATRARLPHLSGPVWLVWRQHRAAFWTGAGLLAALAVFVVVQRAEMVAYIETHDLVGCVYDSPDPRCEGVNAFRGRFYDLLHYTGLVTSFAPLIIGVFLGAPLLSREIENGTYLLSRSQSVSRARWFAYKLGVPALVTLVGTGVLSALYTWWWKPADNMLKGMHWYDSPPFDNVGVVPVAMALLALVTGAVVGMVVRRTVAAMVVTCALCIAGWVGLNFLRPLLWPVQVATARQFTADLWGSPTPLGLLQPHAWPLELPSKPYSSWTVDSGYLTSSGDRFTSTACGGPTDASAACLKAHDVAGVWVEYHPASHFLPMQWATAGVLLAVAAAVTAFSFWWVHRRS